MIFYTIVSALLLIVGASDSKCLSKHDSSKLGNQIDSLSQKWTRLAGSVSQAFASSDFTECFAQLDGLNTHIQQFNSLNNAKPCSDDDKNSVSDHASSLVDNIKSHLGDLLHPVPPQVISDAKKEDSSQADTGGYKYQGGGATIPKASGQGSNGQGYNGQNSGQSLQGSYQYGSGSEYPNGQYQYPNGQYQYPNGQYQYPNGQYPQYQSPYQYPNGNQQPQYANPNRPNIQPGGYPQPGGYAQPGGYGQPQAGGYGNPNYGPNYAANPPSPSQPQNSSPQSSGNPSPDLNDKNGGPILRFVERLTETILYQLEVIGGVFSGKNKSKSIALLSDIETSVSSYSHKLKL